MSENRWMTRHWFRSIILLTLLAVAGSPALMALAPATPVALDTTVRTHGEASGEPQRFAVEIAEAGLLVLEVAVPGSAAVEAKLDLFAGEGLTRIEESPTRLVLVVAAGSSGTVSFGVAAQDPRRGLGRYKLTSGFVALASHQGERFAASPPPFAEKTTEGEEGEEGEEDEEELEIEPNFASPSPPPPLPPAQAAFPSPWPDLCRQGEGDDHGDTLTCATPLHPGRSVAAEIRNRWSDDEDVFRLRLTEMRTVEVATSGDTDTFGSLYDGHGHRLAAADDGGAGSNFRIVKTLSPGLYYLRIEGADAAEGYYLLDTSFW